MISVQQIISRMQRRKFNRNAGVCADIIARSRPRDLGNRICISHVIATGIRIIHCRLAQHIIAIAIGLRFKYPGALDGLLNGLAQHKLLTHLSHYPRHGLADHRLTQTFDRTAQDASYTFAGLIQHLPSYK